ncbi:hypothetical protein M569_17209 [Genlisea aurea]|uniref:Uncharacterized protein n=1 Tax=Genlisea aurea TaxID=192259 RepID=S8D4L1_9LAMI|nr:hypothetical protein M569_17209 [Genlisea aurea]
MVALPQSEVSNNKIHHHIGGVEQQNPSPQSVMVAPPQSKSEASYNTNPSPQSESEVLSNMTCLFLRMVLFNSSLVSVTRGLGVAHRCYVLS